ncbi:MAG: hypothetical protein WAO78_15345 [Roseovarius sp.]
MAGRHLGYVDYHVLSERGPYYVGTTPTSNAVMLGAFGVYLDTVWKFTAEQRLEYERTRQPRKRSSRHEHAAG